MKKSILYISLMICAAFGAQAQQLAMFSEFMLNDFIYNPAMGGKNGIPIINVGYRSQWVGFEGAPKTFYVSGNGTIHTHHETNDLHDIGGYMYAESSGVQTNRGISGSYAYHKEIFADHELSLGAFLGLQEFSIDTRRTILPESDLASDPAIQADFRRYIKPDGSLGMLFYNKEYYAGFSIRQIFRGNFNVGDDNYQPINRLFGHVYIMAGYEYLIDEHFSIQPNILIKAVKAAPAQLDLNAKLNYQDRAFFGLTFRTYDAMSFTLGIDVDNIGEFGYAYDLGISKFRQAHSGTHEFILTFRFEDFKRESKFRKKSPGF